MTFEDFLAQIDQPLDAQTVPAFEEVVVDRRTGQPRHAGADQSDGPWIMQFRRRAEQSLYVFAKGVLGLTRLTPTLHKPLCAGLTRIPPYRKLRLLPRDHLKTSVVSRALPMHALIQPPETNVYLPGFEGASTRVLLAGETATNTEHQLRWIEMQFESNVRLRALWPHRCWDNPRKEARKWNESEMLLPRTLSFPESSIETIGVGGAVTGRHYDILIKDDLATLDAANSPIIMAGAIEWHKASRALFHDPDRGLEFTIGTRWAVYDLYHDIIEHDPSVECEVRSAIEEGAPIFPELFTLEGLDRLRRELGPLFPLLYLNSPVDAAISDFAMAEVREFTVVGNALRFDEDERDFVLRERLNAPPVAVPMPSGLPLNRDTYDLMAARGEFVRRARG